MRSTKETVEALLAVENAIENALNELQILWGDDEGDDPELIDALVTVRTLIGDHTA